MPDWHIKHPTVDRTCLRINGQVGISACRLRSTSLFHYSVGCCALTKASAIKPLGFDALDEIREPTMNMSRADKTHAALMSRERVCPKPPDQQRSFPATDLIMPDRAITPCRSECQLRQARTQISIWARQCASPGKYLVHPTPCSVLATLSHTEYLLWKSPSHESDYQGCAPADEQVLGAVSPLWRHTRATAFWWHMSTWSCCRGGENGEAWRPNSCLIADRRRTCALLHTGYHGWVVNIINNI